MYYIKYINKNLWYYFLTFASQPITIMIATQEKQQVATPTGNYDLIKGDFTPEEGLEIISHLLDKKINFHELKIFSQDIRFGQEDAASLKRISELKACIEQMKELSKEAKLSGKTLRVKSSISVELI
jgi:hypothetical protein